MNEEASIIWEQRFMELVHFQRGHGHCRVPDAAGPLGKWVAHLRSKYKRLMKDNNNETKIQNNDNNNNDNTKHNGNCEIINYRGQLTKERIERLNNINFEWSIKPPTTSWDTRFVQLRHYYDHHGHTRLKRNNNTNNTNTNEYDVKLLNQLGEWLHKQRRDWRCGKLSNDRIVQLQSINVEKRLQPTNKTWDESFHLLVQFRRQYGHVHVPKPRPKPKKHTNYKKKKKKLVNESSSSLEDGEQQRQISEDGKLEAAATTASTSTVQDRPSSNEEDTQNNDDDDDDDDQPNGPVAASSTSAQQQRRQQQQSSNEEDKRSNEATTASASASAAAAAHNDDDDNNNNDIDVDERFHSLQVWAERQRLYYHTYVKLGKSHRTLTKKRVKQLEDVGFDWGTHRSNATTWQRRYEELQTFIDRHGHSYVPVTTTSSSSSSSSLCSPSLGRWVVDQRSNYQKYLKGQKSSLTRERRLALQHIGFAWTTTRRRTKTTKTTSTITTNATASKKRKERTTSSKTTTTTTTTTNKAKRSRKQDTITSPSTTETTTTTTMETVVASDVVAPADAERDHTCAGERRKE